MFLAPLRDIVLDGVPCQTGVTNSIGEEYELRLQVYCGSLGFVKVGTLPIILLDFSGRAEEVSKPLRVDLWKLWGWVGLGLGLVMGLGGTIFKV